MIYFSHPRTIPSNTLGATKEMGGVAEDVVEKEPIGGKGRAYGRIPSPVLEVSEHESEETADPAAAPTHRVIGFRDEIFNGQAPVLAEIGVLPRGHAMGTGKETDAGDLTSARTSKSSQTLADAEGADRFRNFENDSDALMSNVDWIQARLIAAFPNGVIQVQDTRGDDQHLSVTVASAAFSEKSRMACHQMVYAALDHMRQGRIHAMALKTIVSGNGSI